jgi:hypothetical protein
VEKNDTTGGGSFSESSGSVGNKIVESKKSSSPLQFSGSRLTPGVCSLREEERDKAIIYGPSSHHINSTTLVQQVHKGPRIRLTARKRVPQIFEKFTWNSAQARSGSPSPTRTSSSGSSPICALDQREKQAQTRDPRVTPLQARDPTRSPARDPIRSSARNPGLFNTDSIRGSLQARDPVRVSAQAPFVQGLIGVTQPFGPIRPFTNWVWTRNPNLGFSSPSKVRSGPFKRRYDQYSEETSHILSFNT